MKCLICHAGIMRGQYVLLGSAAVYSGPGEDDFDHIQDENDLEGVVHISCLQKPVGAITTPIKAISEPIVEEPIVQREDALAIFDL